MDKTGPRWPVASPAFLPGPGHGARAPRLAGAALALALLLSACGGGGDAPASADRATLAAKPSTGAVTTCPAFPATAAPLTPLPTAEQVLGFAFGSREVTNEEAALYLRTLDAASPRVVTGVAARSVQGRDLGYAIGALGVGLAAHVTGQVEAAFWFVALSMWASATLLWWLGEETHPQLKPVPAPPPTSPNPLETP